MFWGPVPYVGVLKVGTLNMGSKLFTPQGEAGSWGFPPIVWHCAVAFPTHFDVAIFLFAQCVGAA